MSESANTSHNDDEFIQGGEISIQQSGSTIPTVHPGLYDSTMDSHSDGISPSFVSSKAAVTIPQSPERSPTFSLIDAPIGSADASTQPLPRHVHKNDLQSNARARTLAGDQVGPIDGYTIHSPVPFRAPVVSPDGSITHRLSFSPTVLMHVPIQSL